MRGALRRDFHRVLALAPEGLPGPLEGPVLVCLTHSSWWDLMLGEWLSTEVLHWDSYAAMDERQLRRYEFMRHLGVIGVDRASALGARKFLQGGVGVLASQKRALWLTAQGAMLASDARPIRLYGGIAALARLLPDCRILPVAFQYEFWSERKPEALVAFGESLKPDLELGRKELTLLLEKRLEETADLLDVARRSRDAARFHVLMQGAAETQPIYDFCRRIAARSRGQQIDVSHGAVVTPPRQDPPSSGRRRF